MEITRCSSCFLYAPKFNSHKLQWENLKNTAQKQKRNTLKLGMVGQDFKDLARLELLVVNAIDGGAEVETVVVEKPILRRFELFEGLPVPFGAMARDGGVNFAIHSTNAVSATLCLISLSDLQENRVTDQISLDPLTNKTGDVWHVFLKGDFKDMLYGYTFDGNFSPAAGHYYDASRILLDPYAKAVISRGGYGVLGADGDCWPQMACMIPSPDDEFDWEGDLPLKHPQRDLIIYEMHVRGFTRHESSKTEFPGTYLGVVEKLDHLKELGVNCIELMPCHEFNELEYFGYNSVLGDYKMNFWGYSTVNFFSPMIRYSSAGIRNCGRDAINEVKLFIREAHKRGIEVLMDVVFNHTAEGNENGPILSFRGVDNSVYYMVAPKGEFYNYSGCGNTFNCNHPIVRQFVLDCLRYWATEMHVDGFRFDLASILTRGSSLWDADNVYGNPIEGDLITTGTPLSSPPLIDMISNDSILRGVKRKTKLHLKFYKLHIYFAALKKKLGPYTMVTFKDVNTPKRNTLVISDDDEAGAKTTLNTFEPIIGKFAQKWKASVKPPALESWTKGNVLYSSHHCKATDELYPHLIDNIMKDKAIWGSNVKFNGEFHFIPSYWEWTEEVLSRNQKVLRDAQLYDAIYASLFTYSQDVNIIRSFCEFWCATTNTLHTQSGEVSISLWDLHVIGGLSIEGIFYDEVVPTAKELTSVDQKGNLLLPKSCHYLLTAYHYLKKTKKGKISPIDWINFWYKGEVRYTSTTQKKSRKAASSYPSGSFKISPPLPVAHEALTILEVEENLHEETYLAAFLSCWLCVFALPNKDGIRPSTFKIASLMAKGRIISLAIPVLAAIYQGLKVISLSSVPGKDKSYFPFHYVYAWLGRYFKTHEPINHLVNGPYMTKISGEQAIKHIDLASSYKCIAFGRGIVWNTTTMIRKTESIFVDDGKLNLSKLSYFFSLRSGYLTLRQEDSYIIHHYSPHRYSRQFGFHQDLPGDITRHIISANAEEMFQYHETLIGLNTKSTIFIPAFSIDFSSRFTARFKEWWSSLHGNYFVDAVKTMVKSPPTKEKASLLKTAMPKVPESSDETPEASAAPRTLNNVRTTLRVISTPVQCFPISHDQEYQRGCERGSPSKKHSREQLRIHEVLCDDEADVQSEECWRHAKRQNIQILRDVINNSQSPIGNQEHVSFGNISDLASKKENELSHTNAEVSNIFKNKDDEVSSQSNHGCNQPRKNMILVEQSVFSSTNLIPKFRYNHCRELGLATLKEFSKCTLDGVIPFGRHFENVCSEIDGSGVVSSALLRNIFHEFSERVRRHLSNGLELKDASTIDDHDVHTSKIRAQLDININHDLSLSEKIASLQDQSLEITMEIERLKRKQAIINSSILEMEDDQKEVKSNISTLQEDLVKLQNVPLLDEAEMEAFKKTQALLEKELADFKNLKWLD